MNRLFIILLALFCPPASSAQGHLQITIKDFKVVEGSVRIGLFNNKRDFLKKPIQGRIVRLAGDSVTVVFKDLRPGDYAISLFHDINNNGRLDTNVLGIPSEGFAFGNNALGIFGPPSFDKAKITIKAVPIKQVLNLKNF